jgi:hydrogenase maturation protease
MNLVIGLGNILFSDEGIGIHILKELEKRNNISNAKFLDLGTSSLDLDCYIKEDTKKIAVIDCIKTKDYEYGNVFKFSVNDLKQKRNKNYSLHQLEFIDSINLMLLSCKMPQIIIFGVVPFDIETPSLCLSKQLSNKLSSIVKKIEEEIIIYFND